jgi:hypothetical protein
LLGRWVFCRVELFRERGDSQGDATGGLVVLEPSFEDHDFLFFPFGELARCGQLGLRFIIALKPMQIVGQPEVVIEVVGVERNGLGERRDRLFYVAKASQNLGQPRQVFGVLVGAVGDLCPGGLGLIGPLEVMQVFTDIFVVLRVGGR